MWRAWAAIVGRPSTEADARAASMPASVLRIPEAWSRYWVPWPGSPPSNVSRSSSRIAFNSSFLIVSLLMMAPRATLESPQSPAYPARFPHALSCAEVLTEPPTPDPERLRHGTLGGHVPRHRVRTAGRALSRPLRAAA